MRSETTLISPAKYFLLVSCAILLGIGLPPCTYAQNPIVPPVFQATYEQLDNYLISFNASLPAPNGPPYPTLMAAALKAADANDGPQLLQNLNGAQLSPEEGVQLQINALKATGAQAIMVEVGFPMLYEPFLDTQGTNYQQQFTTFYQDVANAIHQAGLKVIVENDTLMVNDVSANWDVAPFYATLDWDQYQAARAADAVTIAQLMQPDYMVLLQEPITEAENSGQSEANTPSGSLSLLTTILSNIQQTGFPNIQFGAGTGTSQENSLEYIQEYVTLPLNFIDIHIYPINNGYLPMALTMASTAAAAHLPVTMSECWMWKVNNDELGVLTPDQIRARDPFSFWAPLDAYFLQTMQALANATQMVFLDPFGIEYFFDYQTYGPSTEGLSPSQILSIENQLVQATNQNATPETTTGMSYYSSLVVPPDTTPPLEVTGLTGVSGNPTQATLNWTATTDNVGVYGYNVFRDGAPVGTTADLYYQDSGLTQATTYTYTIQAFDLAGNFAPFSAPVQVQTIDVTPPSTPQNVTATALGCTHVTVTWSPSTDNVGVAEYLVWMGLSPTALTQVGTTNGTTTTWGDYNLSPATTYYFGVEAEDKDHNISYMSQLAMVTTPALPQPPASVTATPLSCTKVSLSWSASVGGLSIAHYMIYRGASPTTLVQIVTVNNTSFTDTTVSAATTYYYAIQASDSGSPPAKSGLSQPAEATTFSPPGVPPDLVATAISCTKVKLTWLAAASGGLPIANYHVYKGSTPTTLTQLAITQNLTFTDTSDTALTTYYYAVQSADTALPPDLSPISPPVAVTTFGYPGVPPDLTATTDSSSKITVSWQPPPSGGLPISNYHVYRGFTPSTMTQVAVITGTTYNNYSLTPGTLYYYSVSATDTANDSSPEANPVRATTYQLPTTPTNVVATGTSSSVISVTWSPSTGALPIAHYFVFRGSTAGNMAQIATVNNPSYTDRNLPADTTYYYGIQADDTANDHSTISAGVPGTTQ